MALYAFRDAVVTVGQCGMLSSPCVWTPGGGRLLSTAVCVEDGVGGCVGYNQSALR